MSRKNTKSQAKKDSLIGIDPLAWLNEDVPETQTSEQDRENPVVVMNEPEVTQLAADEENTHEVQQPEATTAEDEPTANEVINMGTSMTIREAAELYTLCKDGLRAGQTMKIDCSEVEKTDASGLQLLTALCRHAKTEGSQIEWVTPSENVRQSAGLLGLSSELAF